MSTSSKALKKLLENKDYFQEIIIQFLECKGNKNRTNKAILHFLCELTDKPADIEQALASIKKLTNKIKNMTTSEMAVFEFPKDFSEKEAKYYLYKLFKLLEIHHEIYLYCRKKEWDKAVESCHFMMLFKEAEEISSYFSRNNPEFDTILNCSTLEDKLAKNEDKAMQIINLDHLKTFRSFMGPRNFKEIFPELADLTISLELSPELSPKRRRLNPTEDD